MKTIVIPEGGWLGAECGIDAKSKSITNHDFDSKDTCKLCGFQWPTELCGSFQNFLEQHTVISFDIPADLRHGGNLLRRNADEL